MTDNGHDPQAALRAQLRAHIGRGPGKKSAKGLAAALGLAASQVSKIIGGGRLVKAHELAAIEEYIEQAEPNGQARLRLRELMDDRGWTFQELSNRTEISVSMLSRAARQLGDVFGVPPGALIEPGGEDGARPDMEPELKALEDLIAAAKLVRAGDAAVAALLDAMAEQVAKMRAKMPVG
jgi:transcriptional regulator with XRE-family HTH domain